MRYYTSRNIENIDTSWPDESIFNYDSQDNGNVGDARAFQVGQLPKSTHHEYPNELLRNYDYGRMIQQQQRVMARVLPPKTSGNIDGIRNQHDQTIVPSNASEFACNSQLNTRPLDSVKPAKTATTDSMPNNPRTIQRVNESKGKGLQDDNFMACKCTKIPCSKRYCGCLSQGNYCSKDCTCTQCFNTAQNEDPALKARRRKLNKSDARITCNCKDGCHRKYCMCFKADVGCSAECRCHQCKNPLGANNGKVARM